MSFRQYGRRRWTLRARHAGAWTGSPRVPSTGMSPSPDDDLDWLYGRDDRRPSEPEPTQVLPPDVLGAGRPTPPGGRSPYGPAPTPAAERPVRAGSPAALRAGSPAALRAGPQQSYGQAASGQPVRPQPAPPPAGSTRLTAPRTPGPAARRRPEAGQAEAPRPPRSRRAGRGPRSPAGVADRRPGLRLESDRPGRRRPQRAAPGQPARYHLPAGRLGLPRGLDQGREEEARHRQHGRSADGHDHDLVHPAEREAGPDLDPP